MTSAEQTELLRRWRLILGEDAGDDSDGSESVLSQQDQEIDRVLGFLFDREHAADLDTVRERGAGSEPSRLTVPRWLARVRRLFPRSVAEQLTHLALERYHLTEILADEELLETVTPDMDLLRAVLAVKDELPERILKAARRIVRRVVDELRERLVERVRQHFGGTRLRKHSNVRVAKNFDAARTIRKNLRHYSTTSRQIQIERPYFFSRLAPRHRWDIVLLVDQSGSMMDSVIHAAVLASIFRSLGGLRCRFVLFDTSVVDLTEELADPLDVLFRAQLGGGTDIAQAMRYAEDRIENPHQTIVILVTDFLEGGSEAELLRVTGRLVEAGVVVLGLAALDDRAEPAYDRDLANRLAQVGMSVAAMTPDRLAEWVAERVRA